MRLRLALAGGAGFAAATACLPQAVAARPLPVAVSVSPARVAVVAPAARAIEVRNFGAEPVVIDVAQRAVGRGIAWKELLSIRPARVVLRSGAQAVLTMRVRTHARATPGDHQLLALLIARPLKRSAVGVRMRLGIRVRVRVPGQLVRRLALCGLRRRKHTHLLLACIGNGGNVIEQLRRRLTVTVVRRGRVVIRFRPRGLRELMPGTRTAVPIRYPRRLRGSVTAVVRLRRDGRLRPLERRYRLRL